MDGVWVCMWMRCVYHRCERVWVYLHCVCGVWVLWCFKHYQVFKREGSGLCVCVKECR